jgi:hypothetical protein
MRSKKFYYFMQNWSSYPLKSFLFILTIAYFIYLLDLKKAMCTEANIDYLLLLVFLDTKDGIVKTFLANNLF